MSKLNKKPRKSGRRARRNKNPKVTTPTLTPAKSPPSAPPPTAPAAAIPPAAPPVRRPEEPFAAPASGVVDVSMPPERGSDESVVLQWKRSTKLLLLHRFGKHAIRNDRLKMHGRWVEKGSNRISYHSRSILDETRWKQISHNSFQNGHHAIVTWNPITSWLDILNHPDWLNLASYELRSHVVESSTARMMLSRLGTARARNFR